MTTAARQWPVRAAMDVSRRRNALAKKKENNAGAPNALRSLQKLLQQKGVEQREHCRTRRGETVLQGQGFLQLLDPDAGAIWK